MGGCVSHSDNGIRLRTLLPLDDIELHIIALFQSLITIQLNCRVVDENIRPVITSDESVALGVVEPLDFAFVLSHRVLPFLPLRGLVRWSLGKPAHPIDYDADSLSKVYRHSREDSENDRAGDLHAGPETFSQKVLTFPYFFRFFSFLRA